MRMVFTFLLFCGLTLHAAPSTNTVATAIKLAQFAAAEVIYRSYFPSDHSAESRSNIVYCLWFGKSDTPLPPEFMQRFTTSPPHVTTGTNSLIFTNRWWVQRDTRREVVFLALKSLKIHARRAEAKLTYRAHGTMIMETIELSTKDGKWTVDEKITGLIACGG
jgi:hypothetical protein